MPKTDLYLWEGVYEYEGKEYKWTSEMKIDDHYNDCQAYSDRAQEFYYTQGNMSCDCNLSRELGLPEMPCGDEIILKSYKLYRDNKLIIEENNPCLDD